MFAAAAIAVAVSIATGSAQAFARYGVGFVWSTTYSPGTGQYGAGILVVGTVVTTGVAIILAAPVGLGAALSLSELVPKKVAAVASALVELLAAVPSIVVGLWALLVLTPIFRTRVEPFLHSVPVLGLLFGGPAYGPSIILASTVLAVMTLPTLIALSRTAFRAVPLADREAAFALGATRWQVVRKVVWPAARSGVGAAVTLAIGRALGEAIAVAMVIGNIPELPHSLSGESMTLGSAIVNQFGEAEPGLGTSSVIALGAVLLVLTVAVNIGGQALRRAGRAARAQAAAAPVVVQAVPLVAGVSGMPYAPGTSRVTGIAPARASGNELVADRKKGSATNNALRTTDAGAPAPAAGPLRARPDTLTRRMVLGWMAAASCNICLLAAAAPLVALIVYTVARAAPALSFGLLTNPVVPAFVGGGGIGTAIAGSARAVGLGLVMAAPIGLLGALFLYERQGRLAATLRFGADVLTGVPSILIGIFAYEVVVRPMHRSSVVAAGIALAVLMLPIMVRANEEAVRAVPVELQEAGAALGAHRWRVVRSIVLRGSLPGVVAGNLLALSRAVGETAPLLFTVASPSLALTLLIFEDGRQPFISQQQLAWAAALVLLVAVLALSALARLTAWLLTRRSA